MPRTAWPPGTFCGAASAEPPEAGLSPVMLRTAPCSCSSETVTTCEGMQPAWANARTAVSSPTNSTVLVRSVSGSPGVRHEVQS